MDEQNQPTAPAMEAPATDDNRQKKIIVRAALVAVLIIAIVFLAYRLFRKPPATPAAPIDPAVARQEAIKKANQDFVAAIKKPLKPIKT